MSYVLDFLFGLLGFLVGALIWEFVEAWVKREWKILTTRKSFTEVMAEIKKDIKRPKQPPLKPGKGYSVAEILAMAREENRQGP